MGFHRPIPVHPHAASQNLFMHCLCHQQTADVTLSKSLSGSPLPSNIHKCNSPTLLHGGLQHHSSSLLSHPRLQAVLSNPSTSSSSGASSPASGLQPSSLPPQLNVVQHSHHQHYHHHLPMCSTSCSGSNSSSPLLVPPGGGGLNSDDSSNSGNGSASSSTDSRKGMSRSISDSTLRRAALHLNLNQSVLPSFTSLQQFKVSF